MAKSPSVVVVDLGLGNLGSVRRALAAVGAAPRVSRDPEEVVAAERLVVPGQGAFGDFATALEKGHGDALGEALRRGTPYLGICLGMQGLFEESDEAEGRKGLGHFQGRVVALEPDRVDPRDGGRLKVPHMGWNLVRGSGFDGEPWFYFVHSYACAPRDSRNRHRRGGLRPSDMRGDSPGSRPRLSVPPREEPIRRRRVPEAFPGGGMMKLIPAIDLLGGQVVRLHKGRYDEVTVYADDPAEMARRFADEGADWLHVVDLDGARSGSPVNVASVEAILGATGLRVQVGGGVRTAETANRWLAAGASRVVVGTAAVKSPQWVRATCESAPEAVVVAIDARDGEVAVEGWLEGTGRPAAELAAEIDGWAPGPWGFLYTNIDRDGTREGPDVEGTAALARAVGGTVIASGGIGSLAHLRALAEAGVEAAVCGRALYAGAFTLREALDALAEGT